MYASDQYTMINPRNGELAFKIYYFDGHSPFTTLQRLNHFSLILLKSGSGGLTADFTEYAVGPGTLLSFSPYQPFMLQAEEAISGLAVHFHPEFFCIFKHHQEIACNGVLFNNIYRPPYLQLAASEIAHFDLLAGEMIKETQKAELAQYELLISYLKIMLIQAARIKLNQHPQANADTQDLKEPFVLQKLKDAIEQHYRTKHSASDYADLLNITPNALAKITKNHFNKTLTDLISERIIIEAKRELYLTGRPVKEVAYELGFDDEFYFSRFFKKKAGVSPVVYREKVGFAVLGN
jgi:AraC family transcriptional regulator, transcriptional activator of pobA